MEYDYILHIKLIYEHIFHVCVTAIVFRNVSTNIFYSDSERLIFTLICIVLHIKLEIRKIEFIISTLSSFLLYFSVIVSVCRFAHLYICVDYRLSASNAVDILSAFRPQCQFVMRNS